MLSPIRRQVPVRLVCPPNYRVFTIPPTHPLYTQYVRSLTGPNAQRICRIYCTAVLFERRAFFA